MKKRVIFILLALIATVSCNSQNKIDFATIQLPYDSSKILNENYEYRADNFSLFVDLNRYYSEDPNVLYFHGINLDNEVTKKYSSQNHLSFYVDKKAMVKVFRLRINTTKESRKLYNVLVKNFGTPIYFDNDNNDFFTGVWEKENITYIFSKNNTGIIGNIKTESSDLSIVENKELEIIKRLTSSSHFSEFVDAKEQNGNSNYTYENWAQDMARDGDDDYLKALKENKPLE